MKRKAMVLLAAVLAVALVFGACGKQQTSDMASAGAAPTPAVSGSDIKVADIDGQPVYMNELIDYMNMQGYDPGILEDETYSSTASSILDEFLDEKVLRMDLESKGYMDLTDDEKQQVQQNVQSIIDYLSEETLAGYGITKDMLIDQFEFDTARTNASTDETLLGVTAPTEEEIKAEYDSNVAADQQAMDADPTEYVNSVSGGDIVYYVPAGVRLVKSVFIPFEDSNDVDAIGSLRDLYDTQADMLRDAALTKLQDSATSVLQLITSGDLTFDEPGQYADPNMPEGGYAVVTGTTAYDDSLVTAAMALASVGDISGLVPSDNGYLILQFASDVTPGPVAYDSVKDTISSDLKTGKMYDAWTAIQEQWKESHTIEAYYDNL